MTAVRSFPRFVAKKVYSKVFFWPHWQVGWRRLSGSDLWDTQSLASTSWNVLPNPWSRFLADPIAIERDGKTVLFVEDFHHDREKGVISAIEFAEHGPIRFLPGVLEEPWHLSYPFVMEAEGEVWMIPESSANGALALYRADPFPAKWKKEATLLPNIPATDATIVRHENRYWLLTTVLKSAHANSDLYLFSAPTIFGPWRAHEKNPVLRDPRSARSAGKIVERGGRLWRPVQDCSGSYGAAVGIAEIICLSDRQYEQRIRSALVPCREWPGGRLHTLSQAGGFEFIDGSAIALRWSSRSRNKSQDEPLDSSRLSVNAGSVK